MEKRDELEALSAESNISRPPIKRGDVNNEIESFLGEENCRIFRSMTQAEFSKFSKYKVDLSCSYFVEGNKDKLDKFMAYFLLMCSYYRPSYARIMLKEYLEGYLERHDEATFLLGADKQLLFLYLHKESAGIGNTDAWIGTSTLDKVASRNRKGLTTVILSERTFDLLEKSSEFKVIKLGGASIVKTVEVAAKNATNQSQNQNGASSPYKQGGQEEVTTVDDLKQNNVDSSLVNRSGEIVKNSTTVYN